MEIQNTLGSWAKCVLIHFDNWTFLFNGECPIFIPDTLINIIINKIKMDIQRSREFKAAKDLERALNDYGWNPERFAESTSFFHRTLQQELMKTIVSIIKMMGDDGYRTDLRNRASHELCKRIVESGVLDDAHLPFI